MKLLAAFLTLGAVYAAEPVRLPRSVLDVRVEPGLILTVESASQGSDQIAVRSEGGRLLLGPLAPAPAEPASRHVVVGDLTTWGRDRIVVSVLLKLRMDESLYGLVLFDLDQPKRAPEFHDLDGYWCESLAAGPDETLWCAGHQVTRTGREAKDYKLLRRYDRDLRVVQEEVPRNLFDSLIPRPRLMPGPGGSTAFWVPSYRLVCEARAGQQAACRNDLPVATEGRPLPSVALTPTGSLLALLPNRAGAETLSTPYSIFGVQPDNSWMKLDGSPVVPRGVLMAGYGQRGLALWNRTARTISFLEWPLQRVASK